MPWPAVALASAVTAFAQSVSIPFRPGRGALRLFFNGETTPSVVNVSIPFRAGRGALRVNEKLDSILIMGLNPLQSGEGSATTPRRSSPSVVGQGSIL